MKQFACGDVVPGCSKVIRAETEAEILKAVAEHARLDHGLVEVPPQIIAGVKAKITEISSF